MDNRLFTLAETQTQEYLDFQKQWESDNYPHVQGMRCWEYWAATKGLDLKNKTVLDVGSFFTTFPFYLKKQGAIVTASDNYEWLNYRQKDIGYGMTVNQWKKLLNEKGIKEEIFDPLIVRNDVVYDYIFCCSTIEHILNYKKALHNLLKISKNLIITTDYVEKGIPYFNYGRFFSTEEILEIAEILDVDIDVSKYDNLQGVEYSLALIRKLSIG